MKSHRWTAPGNLLIAGEYIVTEEGGPGISAAAGGRAELRFESSPDLRMTGFRNGMEISDDSLRRSVCESYRKLTQRKALPAAGMSVDTGVFYDGKGRKTGFGSSAVAALLFACGLADADLHSGHSAGKEASSEGDVDKDLIVRVALDAHRNWQGGRGSGYDILSSAAGGVGLFIGGVKPTRTVLPWPDSMNAWIVNGSESVSSPGAVRIYQHWKAEHNRTGSILPILPKMTGSIWKMVSLLTSGADAADLLEIVHELACLGADLGREVGVPALPELPGVFSSGDKPWYRPGRAVAKCLGAGNETVLILSVPGGLSRREQNTIKRLEEEGLASPLLIESRGLRLENGL